jgi:hypothetical protein
MLPLDFEREFIAARHAMPGVALGCWSNGGRLNNVRPPGDRL